MIPQANLTEKKIKESKKQNDPENKNPSLREKRELSISRSNCGYEMEEETKTTTQN